ncbi:STAS domain-containing protein [Nocardia africana]|uniref:Anti-anti-sigma factor n=1 Tax=Nocardia africana TaxID=134964 RepID=A0A378WQU6_9NOCA|nr:STAS domain-containing protein [Nocardia africana]MCC3314912.1 STAS domain-containing protein [Nocardia africana]SUA42804.1 anti-anti-sigma factor [Nocardia africana]
MFPSEGEPQPGPLFDGVAEAEGGPRPQLRAVVRERSHAAILCLRGEADTAALTVWRAHIRSGAAVARRAGGHLVIDTTRLSFLGWRALAVLADEADRLPVGLALVSTSPTVARMVDAGDIDAHVPLYGTVVEALGPVGPVGPPRPATSTQPVPSHGRSRPSVRTGCPKAE